MAKIVDIRLSRVRWACVHEDAPAACGCGLCSCSAEASEPSLRAFLQHDRRRGDFLTYDDLADGEQLTELLALDVADHLAGESDQDDGACWQQNGGRSCGLSIG